MPTQNSETRRALAELVPAIRRYAADVGAPPDMLANVRYAHVLRAVLDGLAPAVRINARWYWSEADLPAIAAVFGVRPVGQEPVRARKLSDQAAA